jgi:hypothetical protein
MQANLYRASRNSALFPYTLILIAITDYGYKTQDFTDNLEFPLILLRANNGLRVGVGVRR